MPSSPGFARSRRRATTSSSPPANAVSAAGRRQQVSGESPPRGRLVQRFLQAFTGVAEPEEEEPSALLGSCPARPLPGRSAPQGVAARADGRRL